MPLPRHARTHPTRLAAITIALLFVLMMSGCWMFSIQSLVDGGSDPDLIFDQTLVGAWGHVTEGCNLTLTIQANVRAYDMELAPGQGCKDDEKTTRYLAYLVKLDNHRFLDILPNHSEVCDLCLPAHTFAQLTLQNNTLSLTPLDADWLFYGIRDKKLILTHVGGDGGDLDMTLNAPPPEMKAFLRTYADDKAAFKPSQRLDFTRK